jgi:hypothetical protein
MRKIIFFAFSFVNFAVCAQNEDFELSSPGTITLSSQVSGWTITSGSNNTGLFPNANSCNLSGCCAGGPSESAIINTTGGYIDQAIGNIQPIYSVFGSSVNGGSMGNFAQPMMGNTVLRLNSSTPNYGIERVSKTLAVSQANALFQVAFLSYFATGHSCCDAGAFTVKLWNVTTNSAILCPAFTTSGLSAQCSNTTGISFYDAGTGQPATTSSFNIFNKWQIISFDLSSYIGQSIRIDLFSSDCTAGGHASYAYVDARTSPVTIGANNNTFSAASQTVKVNSCGPGSVTITAPVGLGPYSWQGPGVPPQFTTPSFTNGILTTSIAADFTLSMNPPGACSPLTKVITVSMTPAPAPIQVTGNNSICSGSAVILTASGAASYSWSSGQTSSTVTNYPSATTVYSVTGISPGGCFTSGTHAVTVNPLPQLQVTGANTVCINSGITFTASGASTYSINGVVTQNTIYILPSTSAIYTITGGNGPSCSNSQTIAITVNPSCANVWPGDSNSDGVVDGWDVVELGYHYLDTGPARSSANNNFSAQFASNWTGTVSTGKNKVHADCNGDGTVDPDDTLAIFNNFSLAHAFRSASTSGNSIRIYSANSNMVLPGDWNRLDILIADSAMPIKIYGLVFDINYDNSLIDAAYIRYTPSFFNANNKNIEFLKANQTTGRIHAADVRTDGMDVTGEGKIGELYLKVKSNISQGVVVNVSISNAGFALANPSVENLSGNHLPLSVNKNPVSVSELYSRGFSVFPNPAAGQLLLTGSAPGEVVYRVSDLLGRTLLTGSFFRSTVVNVESLVAGSYVIVISAASHTSTHRVLIQR